MKELIDFKEKIDKDKLEEVCKSIKDGSVIVFPTETVYGIGANALDKSAVKKIFMAKNRPTDNPLIVHISNYDMLDKVVSNVTKYEKILMDKFWPGPLTIILPKKEDFKFNKVIPITSFTQTRDKFFIKSKFKLLLIILRLVVKF